MAYVDIFDTYSTPPVHVMRVTLTATGRVEFSDGPPKLLAWLKQGIRGKGGKRFTPADGINFLTNLKYEYTGAAIRATDVK